MLHMLIHWSFNSPSVIHTASHSRNLPVPVEILPPLPELHDFKGDGCRGLDMARSQAMARALYEDPDFPATDGSIGGVTGDHANPNAAKYLQEMMKLIVPGWVRPAEMIGKKAGKYELWGTEGEPCLFNRVSPYDIKQGYLGDCWLVSAMSTLAEYPDHVRRLFKQKTLSEDGRYDVRLYDPTSEEWKLVTIDDRLPYWQRPGKHGNLCFAAQTPQNEFWPCLLEKAVAKFVMGFYRLDRGWESTAQEMFTGKPSVTMLLDPMPNGYHSPFHIITGKTPQTARHATVYMRKETFDLQYRYFGADASSLVGGKTRFTDEEMWKMVKEWDDKGYCQSCGSRTNYKGILAGLQVVQKTIENRKNLINLRCSVWYAEYFSHFFHQFFPSFFHRHLGVSENSVPLNPMVLLIIIPIKWLFHWEYTQHFQPFFNLGPRGRLGNFGNDTWNDASRPRLYAAPAGGRSNHTERWPWRGGADAWL